MKKELLAIEFRYKGAANNEVEHKTKTITLGVFDTLDEAIDVGNKALEVFEAHFKLNPYHNRKCRFSKNGGCFGSAERLISDLGYLETPFSFFAKITTLNYLDVKDTIADVLQSVEVYKQYLTQTKDNE